MEVDVPSFSLRRDKPAKEYVPPCLTVANLEHSARKRDSLSLLLDLHLDKFDLKHTWEYERPTGTSYNDLMYRALMERTFKAFGGKNTRRKEANGEEERLI